jgi:hypothetical protein
MNNRKTVIQVIVGSLMMHSLCCVLPVVCFLIGLTSVGEYFNIFHQYEWLFITLNLISIGVGFFLFEFHKRKSSCNHVVCHHSSRKSFWIISIISLALIIIPHIYEYAAGN